MEAPRSRQDRQARPLPPGSARTRSARASSKISVSAGDVYTDTVAMAFRNIARIGRRRDSTEMRPSGNLVADSMRQRPDRRPELSWSTVSSTPWDTPSSGSPRGRSSATTSCAPCPTVTTPTPGSASSWSSRCCSGSHRGGLEFSVSTAGRNLQVSGLTFAYDSSKPPAEQLGQISRLDVTSVKIGDEYIAPYLLDPTRIPGKFYYVGMTDQVFNFLNGLARRRASEPDPIRRSSSTTPSATT